jgi:hypothetical protein
VLFSFVYSALRSASHRHKRCTIRTSRHSPRFDRNHPQSPSRNSFIIRTSGIRFCNPFVIRTYEKRAGGDSPSSDPLHRSVPFALLHSRFQQLTRNQCFERSLSRNTGGYPTANPRFEHSRISNDDIRPVCPIIEGKEQRHEGPYATRDRLRGSSRGRSSATRDPSPRRLDCSCVSNKEICPLPRSFKGTEDRHICPQAEETCNSPRFSGSLQRFSCALLHSFSDQSAQNQQLAHSLPETTRVGVHRTCEAGFSLQPLATRHSPLATRHSPLATFCHPARTKSDFAILTA